MPGKKNIVFGFLFLVLTAALGPYMVLNYIGPLQQAITEKNTAVTQLEEVQGGTPDALMAQAQTDAILALDKQLKAQQPINDIKGGPHAHGNLEALLNIAVGLLLGMLVISTLFKEIISWLFILGTLLHSGMLYLAVVLNQDWAWTVLKTSIGPVMLLAGLLLAGVAAMIGLKAKAS
jgi:uncharacterized membrane protein YgdD (TMEM256/DUF423 family)